MPDAVNHIGQIDPELHQYVTKPLLFQLIPRTSEIRSVDDQDVMSTPA